MTVDAMSIECVTYNDTSTDDDDDDDEDDDDGGGE